MIRGLKYHVNCRYGDQIPRADVAVKDSTMSDAVKDSIMSDTVETTHEKS